MSKIAGWLKKLVVGDGNVIRERSYTNWNSFDERMIAAEPVSPVTHFVSSSCGGEKCSVCRADAMHNDTRTTVIARRQRESGE